MHYSSKKMTVVSSWLPIISQHCVDNCSLANPGKNGIMLYLCVYVTLCISIYEKRYNVAEQHVVIPTNVVLLLQNITN